MTADRALWRTEDRRRWFLIPAGGPRVVGDLPIRSVTDGAAARVDRAWAARFETSEEEGRIWAKAELGETLGTLRKGVDAWLAEARQRLDEATRKPVAEDSPIARDAAPALLQLLQSLPRVIVDSLSGDAGRVSEARQAATGVERRLRDAGLNLGGGLARFPDRLEGLRKERAGRRERGAS